MPSNATSPSINTIAMPARTVITSIAHTVTFSRFGKRQIVIVHDGGTVGEKEDDWVLQRWLAEKIFQVQ